ncbi:MAG: gamma-glutamyltransferase family protein [Erysipelotrichaceae bacterium]|nr:gamma-glutamyltransferase family protein [Erysipelotrichaceae bacterium]
MEFDALYQPYPKSRYPLYAKNGVVCSSSPMASSAGLRILQKGGNAVDAAVAAAATLTVCEPTSNGIGSDAFAIVWMKDKLYGLNASGRAPGSISIDRVKQLGHDSMPKRGWIPVMVPGAPKAWASLIKSFGNLSLKEVLEPAIEYASNGYAVGPVLSYLWNKYVSRAIGEYGDRKEYAEWFRTFTKEGRAPKAGDIVRFPDMAKSLSLIGDSDADAFYKGEIARKIDEQSKRDGGFLRYEDLSSYDVEWVDPISVNYRGYDVWEIPPNGQGIVALIALNILKNFDFQEKDHVDKYHKQFEAIKIAFADAIRFVSDPKEMKVDYEGFLKEEYGKYRASMIDDTVKIYEGVDPASSGTVYLCSADREGNMVSYIQSNYMDFGSGIVIEDYGVSLQNRGYDFSLDPSKVNVLKPGKKSYHTIIPGFLTKEGKAIGPFGVMGGYMQPQGHVQVISNLLDFHLNPQACLDAPRWQWQKNDRFIVEPRFDKMILEQLRAKGHPIEVSENDFSYGRGQMILRRENDTYVAAAESRADSNIASY